MNAEGNAITIAKTDIRLAWSFEAMLKCVVYIVIDGVGYRPKEGWNLWV